MDIGDRIKQKRELLGMSQDELAKKVGYKSRSSINKIEVDGRGLPQSKIVEFAKALETTPAYLMGWETPNDKLCYEHGENFLYELYKNLGHDAYTLMRIYTDLPKDAQALLLSQAKGYAKHFIDENYEVESDDTVMKIAYSIPDDY